MTALLQQAIAQIQQLPPDQQDAIAARFLTESQDEQKSRWLYFPPYQPNATASARFAIEFPIADCLTHL